MERRGQLSPLGGEGELILPKGETLWGGGDVTRLNREVGTSWGTAAFTSGAGSHRGSSRCWWAPSVPRRAGGPSRYQQDPPSSVPGARRGPGAGGAGGSAAGADSRAGGGGAGPGPAHWNPDQMYPARQECSASPPGPAAAPRPPPPAPHRQRPRSPRPRHPPGLRPPPPRPPPTKAQGQPGSRAPSG